MNFFFNRVAGQGEGILGAGHHTIGLWDVNGNIVHGVTRAWRAMIESVEQVCGYDPLVDGLLVCATDATSLYVTLWITMVCTRMEVWHEITT